MKKYHLATLLLPLHKRMFSAMQKVPFNQHEKAARVT
jgi:hypothetical protein